MQRHEPQPSAGERSTVEQFLDYQRATMQTKVEGLSQGQLATRLPTSALTLAGLLKHLALVEDDWIQVRFLGLPELEPWASAPWDEDRDWEFHTAEHEDADGLRQLYRAACDRSRQAIAGADLDDLSVGTTHDGEQWNLRWILTHLIEETTRHNGHADLIREAIDGTVGE
ncbi:MAG: DinB family protein [Acidimicrobiales bacterium]